MNFCMCTIYKLVAHIISLMHFLFIFVPSDIRLSFERSRYDVTEQDVEVNDLIYVVKEGNVTTEQILEVFVVYSQNTGSTFATLGEIAKSSTLK